MLEVQRVIGLNLAQRELCSKAIDVYSNEIRACLIVFVRA